MIAWLDASREDQRRMREIVNLFTQSESRDELGIGQVRDTFSDALFPGISTLHTRARYLLFVPWCFTDAAAQGGTAARAERRAAENERALIGGLRELGATDGLIGRVAGVAVKTLPSALYWGALRQYGILRVAEPLDALGITASRGTRPGRARGACRSAHGPRRCRRSRRASPGTRRPDSS